MCTQNGAVLLVLPAEVNNLFAGALLLAATNESMAGVLLLAIACMLLGAAFGAIVSQKLSRDARHLVIAASAILGCALWPLVIGGLMTIAVTLLCRRYSTALDELARTFGISVLQPPSSTTKVNADEDPTFLEEVEQTIDSGADPEAVKQQIRWLHGNRSRGDHGKTDMDIDFME